MRMCFGAIVLLLGSVVSAAPSAGGIPPEVKALPPAEQVAWRKAADFLLPALYADQKRAGFLPPRIFQAFEDAAATRQKRIAEIDAASTPLKRQSEALRKGTPQSAKQREAKRKPIVAKVEELLEERRSIMRVVQSEREGGLRPFEPKPFVPNEGAFGYVDPLKTQAKVENGLVFATFGHRQAWMKGLGADRVVDGLLAADDLLFSVTGRAETDAIVGVPRGVLVVEPIRIAAYRTPATYADLVALCQAYQVTPKRLTEEVATARTGGRADDAAVLALRAKLFPTTPAAQGGAFAADVRRNENPRIMGDQGPGRYYLSWGEGFATEFDADGVPDAVRKAKNLRVQLRQVYDTEGNVWYPDVRLIGPKRGGAPIPPVVKQAPVPAGGKPAPGNQPSAPKRQ